MQKKNVISIFVCMLLIAVSVSSVTGTIDEDETLNMKNDDYNNLIEQVIENGVISNNDWFEQDKLLASDGANFDLFGCSVSISGDYAIVGAYEDQVNGEWSGSAYVFTRSGTAWWTEQAKLLASDGVAGDWFGCSVSIDGDYAIVGAFGDDGNGVASGSAYVFTRSGTAWTQQVELLASDGATYDYFGHSVSIDGEYAIIGAFYDDDNGDTSGSAYIFKRDGTAWTEQAKLLASDGAADDRFGRSVSISGDYAIIGAHYDDDNGEHSGSAYVFNRSGSAWTEQAKLLASDGAASDYFGHSVSIDGEYAIVGAFGDDDNGEHSGSAYIFKRDGTAWTEQAKLLASDGAADDLFGHSVSISGDYAIIGAYYDDDNGDWSGSAYIFKRDGTAWTEQAKLLASDGAEMEMFGCSVSIDGEYAIIGAYYDDDNGAISGSAYLFSKLDPNAPEAPTIIGETDGEAGVEYEYTFSTIDPNDDDVFYNIDWDDGEFEDWFGPYDSGEEVVVSHKWDRRGAYSIRAIAKNTDNLWGPWGTLTVTMPVNQQLINPLLQMILERFPNAFPILRYLLGL